MKRELLMILALLQSLLPSKSYEYNEWNENLASLTKMILEIVTDEDCTLLIYSSDGGNSALRHRLALELQDNNYPISVLSSLNEWRAYIDRRVNHNLCLMQIYIGLRNGLAEYFREIWEKDLTRSSYKYLLILDSTKDILKIKELTDVLNIKMIEIPNSNEQMGVISLYAIQPYGLANGSFEISVENTWKREASGFVKNDSSSRWQEIKDMNGVTLISATMTAPPYFKVIDNSDAGKTIYIGVDHMIVQTIAKYLNFKVRYVRSVDNTWGSQFQNGSWSGLVGMAERQEVDFTTGGLTLLYARELVVDFSISYSEHPVTFITHVPSQLPKWQALVWPFETYLWVFIIASIVGFLIVYAGILFVSQGEKTLTLSKACLNIWGSFFNQGIYHPKKTSIRILLASWFLYSFCIVASYGGSLISFLTLPRSSKPIDTLKDLVESDQNIGIAPGSFFISLLKDHSDPNMRRLIQKHKTAKKEDVACPSYEECLEKTNRDNKFSFITEILLIDENLRNLYIPKTRFYTSNYAIILRRNSPLLNQFNKRLQAFVEMGLIDKWEEDTLNILKIPKMEDRTNDNGKDNDKNKKSLSLNHLQGVFFIFTMGIFGSGVTFLLEKLLDMRFRDF